MNTKLIEKFARQFYKADHSIIQFDDNEVYLSNGDFIFKMPYKDYEIFIDTKDIYPVGADNFTNIFSKFSKDKKYNHGGINLKQFLSDTINEIGDNSNILSNTNYIYQNPQTGILHNVFYNAKNRNYIYVNSNFYMFAKALFDDDFTLTGEGSKNPIFLVNDNYSKEVIILPIRVNTYFSLTL